MQTKLATAMTALLLASLATPASARVPSKRILFASFDGFSSGLRSIKPNGDGRRALTQSQHINPRWSPDRTQIAFERARRGDTTALFVARRNGGGARRLTQLRRDFYKEGFDWSPDGTKIAYATRADESSTHDIHVVDVSSGESTQLTEATGDEYEPVWSPDGSKIAYTTITTGAEPTGPSNTDIAVMDADGSNETLLTEHAHPDYSPQWSPEGSRVSFISERDDEYALNPDIGPYFTEIYVMGSAGDSERRVTDHRVFKDEYEWSPDGSRFAYLGRCDIDVCGDRETDVYAIDTDGTGRRNLTRNERFESTNDIEWSPNGKWVAYVWVQRGGRSSDLMIATAAGDRSIKRVTHSRRSGEGDLDW